MMRKLGMIMEPGNFKKWRGKMDFLKQVVRKANVNELGSTVNLKFNMSRRVPANRELDVQNTKNDNKTDNQGSIDLREEAEANRKNNSEQSKDGVSVRNSEGSISESGLLTIYESCFGFSIVNELDQT